MTPPGEVAPRCFHCDLPIPPGLRLSVAVQGEDRPVCCHGCQAVARVILGQGLGEYYRRREVPADTPDPATESAADAVWNDPAVQRDFVHRDAEGRCEASLALCGLHCAACAWLIERRLTHLPGIESAQVGLATHRARVVWRDGETSLADVFSAIREVGYRAEPDLPDRDEARLRAERRTALRRIGVAGLATMQVMMFSVALYAGAGSEGTPVYRDFLRWTSFAVATLVVLYAARPFFQAAWRDIQQRAPGMDLPVALAIGGAYAASAWATVRGSGEVYFDSVCMFTFFLGVARFLEMRARQRSDERVRALLRRLPETARRVEDGAEVLLPARQLEAGDLIRVRPGETFAADGRVEAGRGAASEALLTGEAAPCPKQPGDAVLAGSQNGDSALLVRVEKLGSETLAATLTRLLDRAQTERPASLRLADRVARYFVSAVLVAAVSVGALWWWLSPADAPWIVLSMLVATCPCALSLATPTALAAATSALAGRGFLATRGHVLETLPRVTHVVLDKTGTVTRSGLQVRDVRPLSERMDVEEVLALARLLEGHSEHPIARAFRAEQPGREREVAARTARMRSDVAAIEGVPGRGVRGALAGRSLRLGRPDWVLEGIAGPGRPDSLTPPEGVRGWVLLADDAGPLAWLGLGGEVRADAPGLARWLQDEGIHVSLVSGDPSGEAVAAAAASLGLTDFVAGATPEQKLALIERLEAEGAVVAVVGDGVNDAPVLGRAAVSIAMGGGTDLARVSADAVLLGDRLGVLPEAFEWARRTRTVVRQNLVWAVLYNASVLPLAATGHVRPWMAALGMSLSSLGVVGNALRLSRPARARRRAEGDSARVPAEAPAPVWQGT